MFKIKEYRGHIRNWKALQEELGLAEGKEKKLEMGVLQ